MERENAGIGFMVLICYMVQCSLSDAAEVLHGRMGCKICCKICHFPAVACLIELASIIVPQA